MGGLSLGKRDGEMIDGRCALQSVGACYKSRAAPKNSPATASSTLSGGSAACESPQQPPVSPALSAARSAHKPRHRCRNAAPVSASSGWSTARGNAGGAARYCWHVLADTRKNSAQLTSCLQCKQPQRVQSTVQTRRARRHQPTAARACCCREPQQANEQIMTHLNRGAQSSHEMAWCSSVFVST